MPWTWQTIASRKHLVVNGRVSCDAIGIPEPGEAMPCAECVEIVLAMERAAFPQ